MSGETKKSNPRSDAWRDSKGRFKISGNLAGRPRKKKRALTTAQDHQDFLAATEEEITATVKGKKTKVPANVLVNKRLVQKAVEGDARCILAVVERRREIMEEERKKRAKLADMLARAQRAHRERPQDFTDTDCKIIEELKVHLNDLASNNGDNDR